MPLLDKLERKIGWVSFPSIIRYLALFQLSVFLLSFFNQTLPAKLEFDYSAILKGEVWRLFTFPFSTGFSGNPTNMGSALLSALLAFFGFRILTAFGDGLEDVWGSFRTTLFVLFGWFGALLMSLIYAAVFKLSIGIPDSIPPSILLDVSIFIAFAIYFPRYELALFLFLPVPVFILAIISTIMILSNSFPYYLPYTIFSLSNVLIILIPRLKAEALRKKHQTKFRQQANEASPDSLHHCTTCGSTEHKNPDLDFRVTKDGDEYCLNCLTPAPESP